MSELPLNDDEKFCGSHKLVLGGARFPAPEGHDCIYRNTSNPRAGIIAFETELRITGSKNNTRSLVLACFYFKRRPLRPLRKESE